MTSDHAADEAYEPYVIRRMYYSPSYWHGTGFSVDLDRAIQFARRKDAEHMYLLHKPDREWVRARVVALKDCEP